MAVMAIGSREEGEQLALFEEAPFRRAVASMAKNAASLVCAAAFLGFVLDDVYQSWLVKGVREFEGFDEIPVMEALDVAVDAPVMVPWNERERAERGSVRHAPIPPADSILCFYVKDRRFLGVVARLRAHLDELRRFAFVVTPDLSLFWDLPIVLQKVNTYFNRAIGCALQAHGIKAIPNVRWGDERSYTSRHGEKPFAFLGVPTGATVAIGSHGCMEDREKREHFKAGLAAMFEWVEPKVVIVYGPMPPAVFGPYLGRAVFIRYEEWTHWRHDGGVQREEVR